MIRYHLPDDQLGQGSSLGNARAWAETKGNGDMLGLYSLEVGRMVLGGMSVTYMFPFSNISTYGPPGTMSTIRSHQTLCPGSSVSGRTDRRL